MKKLLSFVFAVANVAAFGEVIPLSPVGGANVALLREAQKAALSADTKPERLAAIEAVKDFRKVAWREAAPVVLRWRTTDGERGPWLVRLAKNPDFSDGVNLWIEKHEAPKKRLENGVRDFKYTIPRANLELGQTYYWRIWSDVKCDHWTCGTTRFGNGCECGRKGSAKSSAVASFATEDIPPRWIKIEGRVRNIRDLGGWTTADGRRVKTGLAFRGEGLNDNSLNGEEPGRNRLMVEDVKYFRETLGIKTDLDLRSPREVSSMMCSPLGEGVNFINHNTESYGGIFSNHGKKVMAENFRVFCDRANYPIYFHCIGGADRTGALAYVLNGVLGVERPSLEKDWESTFYPEIPDVKKPDDWRNTACFDKGFGAYGTENSSLKERIELYLLDCGVTAEEIARFREIML